MLWDEHIKIGDKHLTINEFKRALEKESTPLFRRIAGGKSPALGPHLDKDNRIMGDMLAVETGFFGLNASQEQKEFHEYLQKYHKIEAYRYLLYITNSMDIWKKDVQDLKDFLKELKKDKKELIHEEHDLENLTKRENLIKTIPAILKSHFPDIFDKIETDYKDLDQLMQDLRQAEIKIHSVEQFLDDYLKKLKDMMPFLFK